MQFVMVFIFFTFFMYLSAPLTTLRIVQIYILFSSFLSTDFQHRNRSFIERQTNLVFGSALSECFVMMQPFLRSLITSATSSVQKSQLTFSLRGESFFIDFQVSAAYSLIALNTRFLMIAMFELILRCWGLTSIPSHISFDSAQLYTEQIRQPMNCRLNKNSIQSTLSCKDVTSLRVVDPFFVNYFFVKSQNLMTQERAKLSVLFLFFLRPLLFLLAIIIVDVVN